MSKVYDGVTLPGTKADGVGAAENKVTAAEFNTLVATVEDLRQALLHARFMNFDAAATESVSAASQLKLKMASNRLMASANAQAFKTLDTPYTDVRDHGAGLGGDDTAAVVAAVAAAVTNGTRHIHFPAGSYHFDHGAGSDSAGLVTIPSNFTVTGAGWGKSILWQENTTEDAGADGRSLFICADGTHHVTFSGLHFKGQNGVDGTGFSYVLNNQNSCITTLIVNSSDITIRDCKFQDLWGFSIHDPGSNQRIHVMQCTFINCANGINVNAKYSLQYKNICKNSEGLEASGAYSVIEDNIITNCLGTGISAGGDTSGAEVPGMLIKGNLIEGGTGIGIALAEGLCYSSVTNNIVRKCDHGGILARVFVSDCPLFSCVISNNIVDSNCKDPGANLVGIDIDDSGVPGKTGGHIISGNLSIDSGVDGFSQHFGLALNAPNCIVTGNYFSGTDTGVDAQFSPNAIGTYEFGNWFVHETQQVQDTATFVPIKRSVSSGIVDSVAEFFRVWTETNHIDYGRFARTFNGKFEWGTGLAARDTNLYRAAADSLKTDDKFTAASFESAGKVNLTGTGSANGVEFGGDVNLYRSAADTLKTDDAVILASTLEVNSNATIHGSLTLDSGINWAGPISYAMAAGITAHPGGGQSGAVLLDKEVHFVTAVATAHDSVKLPTTSGSYSTRIVVFNKGAEALDIFPQPGCVIDSGAANDPYELGPGQTVEFYSASGTQWYSKYSTVF